MEVLVPSAVEAVVAAFRDDEMTERGLAPLTMKGRGEVVSLFLRWRLREGDGEQLELAELSVPEVHAYVLARAEQLSARGLDTTLGALRGFFRFAFRTGLIGRDLSGGLPSVATRRHRPPGYALDTATVAALLATCDRDRSTGLRDRAVLLLMVRLGLRANEIAMMRLEDLDWRAGELIVRGKGRHDDRLPLPEEVGAALAAYLREGRPSSPAASSCRVVFLRARTPAGPLGRNGVVFVPRTASLRAGLPVIGAHRLRHTAAASLLAAGASWAELGAVLRHHRTQTSAIYASTVPATMSLLARPWPDAGSAAPSGARR